jgi:shikimate kinase
VPAAFFIGVGAIAVPAFQARNHLCDNPPHPWKAGAPRVVHGAADMAKTDNISLVGPMGAGKTTIGRRLADLRSLRFVDSDHEVEGRCGVDIAYIFEKEGECGFRRREHQLIDELTQAQGIVLATGGGAILDPHNRGCLAERGFVVYLHASVDQQLARTARSASRPLLQRGDRRATLETLFSARDPLYREIADLVIHTDGRTARALAREIERQFVRAAAAARSQSA